MADHPSAADIPDLYERFATAWDDDRPRTLFERGWLDRFAALITPGRDVLDLGCGSGEPIARHLVEGGFAITGVDASPSLIALARRRMPAQHWEVGDMRAVALSRRFAGILAWDSFFHLPRADQRAMFSRFAAHAVSGTALMFTSGPHDGEAIGSYRGSALYHASLAPEEYRSLLAESGFEVVAHVAEDPDCGGRTVWLCRSLPG